MAVINDPTVAANIQRVGNVSYVPAHVVHGPYPVGAGGAYKLAMFSGTMAASLAINSEIFQFRYQTGNARKALVHGIAMSMAILTLPAASTTIASGPYSFKVTICRGWSVAGSGGTRAVLTGNNSKLKVGHSTSELSLDANNAGISSTAALTPGTKTIDGSDIGGAVSSFSLATAVGMGATRAMIKEPLFGVFPDKLGWPGELAHQEGFIIRNNIAMPATMTWAFSVEVAWSEVEAF